MFSWCAHSCQVDDGAWCASRLLRGMARKSRNTAAVASPILMLLLLWSASNTLRAVDGLFLKVRHSQVLAVL